MDNIRVNEDHCESREAFRTLKNDIDANNRNEKTIDEAEVVVESDVTNREDLGDETHEEADCDVNEYVCICNYCGNWFGSQESLLIHIREKHLTGSSLSYSNMQYAPPPAIAVFVNIIIVIYTYHIVSSYVFIYVMCVSVIKEGHSL